MPVAAILSIRHKCALIGGECFGLYSMRSPTDTREFL